MATVRSTINLALRKIGRLAAGREARATDAEDAFEGLKGGYRYLITAGAFGRLYDVIPTADYTARPSERIAITDNSFVITLPEFVYQDGGWGPWDYGRPLPYPYSPNINSLQNVGPPRDGSIVVIANHVTGIMSDFIYDGTIQAWLSVNGLIVAGTAIQPLGLDDPAPMSTRDPQGLAAFLATRIADDFGADVPDRTAQQANHFLAGITNNFSFPRQETCTEYF